MNTANEFHNGVMNSDSEGHSRPFKYQFNVAKNLMPQTECQKLNANKLESGITVASLINEALGEKVKITVLEATDRLHGRLQTVDLDGIKVLVS